MTGRLAETLKGTGVEPATGSEMGEMRNGVPAVPPSVAGEMRDGGGTTQLRLQYPR